MLSSSQRKVENLVLDGYNVFISGEAGSGKSFFLRSIKKLKEAFGFSRVAVVAPTGIAAVNVGGTTIHSFAGIGTGSKGAHELISRIQANPDVVTRWRNCSVLVIDKISMLSRELFEKLELIARSLNGNTKPFGGIQLIFSGDFYQLKPVVTDEGETSEEDIYCFARPLWNDCIDSSLFFSENYRQDEVELKLLLRDLRKCELSPFSRHFIKYLSRPLRCDPLEIVRLYSHRDDVSTANDSLELLPGEKHSYLSKDNGEEVKLKSCPAPRSLVVKTNARVVLLKNISASLVNGLRGIIHSFVDNYPCVRFDNDQVEVIQQELFAVEEDGSVVATRKQLPLDLAYAMTVHKSQGMSFDFLEVDFSKVFEPGQAYVAVSRAKTINGLRVLSCKETLPKISALVEEFYSQKIVRRQKLISQISEKEKRSVTL